MKKKNLIDDILMYFWRKNPYWYRKEFDPDFDDYFLNISDRVSEQHFALFDENGIPMKKYSSL